jgi:uncharacterized protein YeaO (DUF488 family)
MPQADRKKLQIFIKRAYENPTPEDGYRVLVDRVWPRGRSKAALALDQWESDLAPSTTLRKWFGHDPKRWEPFEQRYQSELASEEQQERMRRLLSDSRGRPISLIYGAKDENHNQAVVLRDVFSCLSEE